MPKQLYILPFDHRASFFRDLFGWKEPLTKAQYNKVKEAKQIIWYAFVRSWAKCKKTCQGNMGILVDEEFGTDILKAAKKLGAVRILTTEKSGQKVFDFEFGSKFGQHLLKFKPEYAKVLVRYNPVNKKDNLEQLKRLKKMSDFCLKNKIGFLFELLVPATDEQLKKYGKNYDLKARPGLSVQAMKEINIFGIKVDIWKLEAMPRNYWAKIIKVAGKAQIVVLGRAGSKAMVSEWLKCAAKFKQIIGFAVGRTIFFQPLEQWRDGKISKDKAIGLIAGNFEYFIDLWERSKK
jgi:5-dehydro-2-deoxygluconokinase